MRSLLLLLAGFVVFLVSMHAPADGSVPQAGGCNEVFRNEPIVVFNMSGAILAGHIEESLIVYNTGHVVHARAAEFEPEPTVEMAYVPLLELRAFFQDLVALGAGGACDQDLVVTETPLRTLTMLRGQRDSFSHTFSYYGEQSPYVEIDERIFDFLAATFP